MSRKYVLSMVMVLLLLMLWSVSGLPQTETDCAASIEGACQRGFAGCLNACTGGDARCQQACAFARGLCR